MQLVARFHWLAFTVRLSREELMGALGVAVYGGMSWEETVELFHDLGVGGNGYKNVHVGLFGVRVYSSPRRSDVHVVVPGGACDCAEIEELLTLFGVPSVSFKRIDVALDGVERLGVPLDPVWLFGLAREHPECLRTRVHVAAPADPESGQFPESFRVVCGRNGSTFYLGAAASERSLRVYDRRGFARMELQLVGDKARFAVDIFAGIRPARFPSVVVGLLRGFVDFIQPVFADRSACPLQDWWELVCAGADKITPAVPSVRPQLDKTFRFFRLQWGAFVTTCVKAYGGDLDLLCKVVEEGSSRFSARHQRLIDDVGGAGQWVPSWQ